MVFTVRICVCKRVNLLNWCAINFFSPPLQQAFNTKYCCLYQRRNNNCQFYNIANSFNELPKASIKGVTIIHGLWHFRSHHSLLSLSSSSPSSSMLLLLSWLLMSSPRHCHPPTLKTNIETNKKHHKICSTLCTWWNSSNSPHVFSHHWGFINKLCWEAYLRDWP